MFQVPLEDLELASHLLVEALQIRHHYMNVSHQTFCATTACFLNPNSNEHAEKHHDDKQTIEGKL